MRFQLLGLWCLAGLCGWASSLDEKGFVRDWLVSGPYPNYQKSDGSTTGFATDYLLDAGGESFAFPQAGERRSVEFVADKSKLIAGQGSVNEWGKTETFAADATWRKVRYGQPIPVLDAAYPGVADYFVQYALAYFTAEREETVKIAVGADDHHVVWVNDVRLGGKESSQAASPGTFNYWVKLRKGRNKILFKLVEVGGGCAFCVQILEKEGKPVPGIVIDNDLSGDALSAFRRELHPPRSASALLKENAALQAKIAALQAKEIPALERRVRELERAKKDGKAKLMQAFETAERNFAAERARNLAGAPKSVDLPLDGSECRKKLCLNGQWEGSLDGGRTWTPTRLPRLLCCHYAHEWFTAPSARDDPFAHVPKKDGTIRYRTAFDWDGAGAVDFLCETIVGTAKVTCNGVPSGEYDGIIGIVCFPLAGLKPGRNELEIELGLSKWPKHEREGILGDLYLEYLPEARVEGVEIKTSWTKATVSAKAELRNRGKSAAEFEVRTYVTEAGRVRLELPRTKVTLGPGETKTVETASKWADPKVWGIGGRYGDPDLYTLVTDVWAGGRIVDRQREVFGFREFRIFHTDFFLNGRRIVLQGDTGALLFEMQRSREIAWDILRNDGVNIIRVHDGGNWSVPTVAESDRMGMLIYAQNFPVMKESLHAWNLANYERWWKTFRNHPSVVIWCTDNETLTQAWDTAAKAEENIANEKFVVRYEKYVKGLDPTCVMTRDGDLGTQNHRQRFYEDPPCDTANYHYPDFNVKEQVVNWRKTYEWRPVIFGETLYGSYCAWDKWIGPIPSQVQKKAEKVRRIVGVYRDEEIPAAVYMGIAMDGYAVADETGRGNPYGITESQRRAYEKDKTLPPGFTADEYPWGLIAWPSMSGRGLRHPGVRRHYWYYTCEIFNAYDPKWPTHVRNAVADAYRETLLKQPKLRVGADAEALVVGAKSGEDVWATCPDGSVLGMRADANGKAWFREIDPGNYVFTFGGREVRATLAPRGDAVLSAGFGYLDVVK